MKWILVILGLGIGSTSGAAGRAGARPSGPGGVEYLCRNGSLTYDIRVYADQNSATVTVADSHAPNPAPKPVGSPCSALITNLSLAVTCAGSPGYSMVVETSTGEWADGHVSSPGSLSGARRHGGDDSDELCKRQ